MIDTDAALIAARDAVAAVRKAVGNCPWIRWGADVHEGIRYSGVALQDAHEKLLDAEESLTVAIYHRQAAVAEPEVKPVDEYVPCIECGKRQHSALCKNTLCCWCCADKCKCGDESEPLCTDKRCTTKGVANPNCIAERCLSCCLRYCGPHCKRSDIEVAERREGKTIEMTQLTKKQRDAIAAIRSDLPLSSPWSLTFAPTAGMSDEQIAKLEADLKHRFELWANTWITPRLDIIEGVNQEQ